LYLLHRGLTISDKKFQAGESIRTESGNVGSSKGNVKKNELPLPALSAQIVPP